MGPVLFASVLAAAAVIVCGALGSWQWSRAHQQGDVISPDAAVPIAELTVPGGAATGIGRSAIASGRWGDGPAAVLSGREVDGQDAVLLILPLEVDAQHTGIDQPATVAVIAGWLPADAEVIPPGLTGAADVEGYLRGSESLGDAPVVGPNDTVVIDGMSTAALSQVWSGPVYSALLVADDPAEGWNALPLPEPERRLDLRSLTYAAEWWIFGVFAVFLAVRWIRDNGRVRVDAPTEGEPR